MDVAAVRVRGRDALLERAGTAQRGEDEGDLGAVGRPLDVATEAAVCGYGQRDLCHAAAVGVNHEQRAMVLECDLSAVGRPTAVVVAEAPRADAPEPGPVDVHDVERRVGVATVVVPAQPAEDNPA